MYTWWDFNHISEETASPPPQIISIIFCLVLSYVFEICPTLCPNSFLDSHCLPKLIMCFPVLWVLIVLMFCISVNIFWLLMVSLGRAWPFSAGSPCFWNYFHFHAAMCSQSQSLCLLGEWCKAHLIGKKMPWRMACGLLVCSRGFNVHVWPMNLLKQSEQLFPSRNSCLECFYDYSHLGSKISAALKCWFLKQIHFKARNTSSLIFKHTDKTCFSTSFRSVSFEFFQIFLLFL